MIKLHLSAAPRVQTDAGVTIELGAMDAALLAWLALEGPTPRTRLALLLWPDSELEAARNALRQRLFQLRGRLRLPVGTGLVTGNATLALAEGVAHDLDEADTVLGEAVGEDMAPGEFAAWLEAQRARRRARARQSLVELSERAERAHDWSDALAHARELLALEPVSEDAHRRVMRLHYLAGDRAAALLAFDACEQVLKHEVGVRPSAETLAVLETIQRAGAVALSSRKRPPPALLRPPRLVGRDEAWQALIDAAEAGRPALVEGEAGMGKSRLVGDFAARAPQASLTVSARPGDGALPYACTARLLRSLVQRCGEPPAALRRTLALLLPEWGEGAVPGPADPDDARAAARLHAALSTMLGRAAEAGVSLIVLDDLHFADAASAETLCALADGDGAPSWLITLRPREGPPAVLEGVGRLLAHGRARHVVLKPLGVAQLAEVVDSLAVPGWAGAAMAPRLARHTGGNPLFLLETLKSMLLEGDGNSSAARLPAASSVTELVSRRIGRLSPGAVKIARCAALAGEDFSALLATHLLAAGPLELADAWAELEAAQVLHEQSFAHDLIREAAAASVPAPLARELHAQIAEYLSERGGAPQRIAAHWQASPQPLRAVPHLLRAGQEAVKALRRHEAGQAYLQAAELLERSGERSAAFDALNSFFDFRRGIHDDLERALEERLLALAETPVQRALVAERRSGSLSQRGEFEHAGAVAEAALALFDHAQAPALAASLLSKLVSGQLQRGDNEAAVRAMYRAVALAETSDDDEAKQLAVTGLGTALNYANRLAEAEPHKVRSVELARQLGKPMVLIDALIDLTSWRRTTGRIDAARASCEQIQALAVSHDIELDRHWPWFGLERIRIALALGEYTAAASQIDETTRLLEQGMPSWRIAADNLATALWMALGQWARARQSAARALEGCERAIPQFAAQARCAALELDLASGRSAGALGRADQAIVQLGAGSARAEQQLLLARSALVPPAEAYALACRVRDDAHTRGLLGFALDAEVHACEAALRGADAAAAAAHARAALALWAQVEPSTLYRARVWLAAARALVAAEPGEHRRLIRQAARWVNETAQQRVPAEFRDSFLHRNRVNRELLAMATVAG